MKLHIYAYASKQDVDTDVDFAIPKGARLIGHWCNHPGLFEFMHIVYGMRGGEKDIFRDATVCLSDCDLDRLVEEVEFGNLPRVSDWLFGDVDSCAKHSYRAFLDRAYKALNKGQDVLVQCI